MYLYINSAMRRQPAVTAQFKCKQLLSLLCKGKQQWLKSRITLQSTHVISVEGNMNKWRL